MRVIEPASLPIAIMVASGDQSIALTPLAA
jgi:hypothetical protein